MKVYYKEQLLGEFLGAHDWDRKYLLTEACDLLPGDLYDNRSKLEYWIRKEENSLIFADKKKNTIVIDEKPEQTLINKDVISYE